LADAEDAMASLVPSGRPRSLQNTPSDEDRKTAFGTADMRALETPQPMSKLINLCLTDLMLAYPEIILAGEDIGRKGGVYGVTKTLQSRFGAQRVIDTLLDEQSILGLAIGLAQTGFIPMPEIQFLAYPHNAEDQLRGEAATLPFFSNGQFTNPMVVRIAGLGYQKGFGGHFHNDNSLAVLRDIPGLIVGCPSNGPDAVRMYREAIRLAREDQRVVAMVEPIALYPMRDLSVDGDGAWMGLYPDADERAGLGAVGVRGTGRDLAIVTYGNGVYLSEQVRLDLAAEGYEIRVIDLRWLAPLATDAILDATRDTEAVLIVDECRRTGSQSEAPMTLFAEVGRRGLARIAAEDSFIATGPAYAATLPTRTRIREAARQFLRRCV